MLSAAVGGRLSGSARMGQERLEVGVYPEDFFG